MNLLYGFLFPLQLVEKQRLVEFAEALRSKLNYFDELENVRFECYLGQGFGLLQIIYVLNMIVF